MMQQSKLKSLKIIGKRPAIDFINTIDWRGNEDKHDYILNYFDLIDWAIYTKLIVQKEATTLKDLAIKDPKNSSELYNRAKMFREAVYKILYHLSIDESPNTEDENLIEKEMRKMFRYSKIDLAGKQLKIEDNAHLDYILSLIVKDTVELLTSEDIIKLKRCYNKDCGWLFIDTSKNNSRKWCQMKGCGNRAKARRHYKRSKQL